MIAFEDAIPSILEADTTTLAARDPETFFAAHIGFCPRQLYLAKLGLTDTRARRGRYKTTRLLQEYLETHLSDRYDRLEPGVSVHIEAGPIEFRGRCNLVDPEAGIVYALKARNGWYKFHPPVERHLDQLHVYMRGTSADRGKLVYVSKNDLADLREWPPTSDEVTAVEFNPTRYDNLVKKATQIREQIVTDGIATTPDAVPFEPCGCYFCQHETLAVDTTDVPTASHTDADDTPTPASSSSDEGERVSLNADWLCDESPVTLDVDQTHVPAPLRDEQIWVVWDTRSKVALAPWQTGTMYPCEWAADKPVDPRRSFNTARMVAELPVEEIHSSWPFPDDADLPATVRPAVLLQHDPPDPPLIVIDLDDVRDPATETIPAGVAALVKRLDGYTEVSASGTGLHVYVRGHLPNETNTISTPLPTGGSLEVYDHSRFIASTWQHIAQTPTDAVPNATPVLNQLMTPDDAS